MNQSESEKLQSQLEPLELVPEKPAVRSDKELLGIQNRLVGEAEGVDFLYEGFCGLTLAEIDYIRALGNAVKIE